MNKYLLLIIIGILLLNKSFSQKLGLPLDSSKKIVYNKTVLTEHLSKNDLFNLIIRWIHNDLKENYPIINNDTIQFYRTIPGYSTEFGGLTYIGLITYKTIIVTENKKYNITIKDIYFIEKELKDTIYAEDILSKNQYIDKWHCLSDIDQSAKELINDCIRKTNKKIDKTIIFVDRLNYNKIENNTAGYEFITSSRNLILGSVLSTIGTLLSLVGIVDYKPGNDNIIFIGLGTMATGLVFTIKGFIHQKKAGYLLEDSKKIKETSLNFRIGTKNLSLVYNF